MNQAKRPNAVVDDKIVLAGKITSYVPYDVYIVWDIRRRCFFRRGSDLRLGTSGIWSSEEIALAAVNNDEENYMPIHIDIVKTISVDAFEDIISLIDHPMWDKYEVEQMMRSKLRQFFEVFLFRNENMKAHFRNQYDKRLEAKAE